MDTVRVKGKTFIILADSSIYVQNDTTFYLPDSVAQKIKLNREAGNTEFYKKLKEKFYKRKVTKEIYDILFVDPPDTKSTPKTRKVPVRDYRQYTGKPIRKIEIKKLEVFGTSINDTSKHINKWAINAANSLHVYTKSRIIRNNIFFEEGDKIDPDLLTDSERVLRNLPYVKDARIYVVSSPDDEEAELLILVKDVWSIYPEFSYSSLEKFNVSVTDRNFIGLGQSFRNEFLYNAVNTPQIGYNGTYTVNNIYKTFITGQLYFARSQPLDRIGFGFKRDFITPETRYAGGFTILKERREYSRIYEDTTYVFNAKYNTQDLWLGRSFLLKESGDARYNLQLSGRYSRVNHLVRPLVEIDTNQQFFDNHLYFFSIGLTKRSYEKSSLITGYGRTEDIPIGYLASFTTGKEINEFYNRSYLGWEFSYGKFFEKLGYLRPTLSLGSFLHNGEIEQGIFKLNIQYFSFLYRYNRTNFRQFFSLSYVQGFNRFDNEFININESNGVRGIDYVFLRGTKKLAFTAETVAFTPIYLLGFRFAPFLFIDMAIVNDDKSKLFKNTLYRGVGLGLRLRNENLAFNTIQIRLGYYPVSPPNNSTIGFQLTGQAALGLNDFRTESPAPISFE